MQKILLIDDDISIYSYFKKVLNPSIELVYQNDFQTISFSLSLYDLIIVDLFFSEKKCLDFLRNLKIQDSNLLNKVILITGSRNIDDEIEIHSLGVRDLIKKPFHASLLKVVIEKHLFTLSGRIEQQQKYGPFTINLNTQQILVENKTGGYSQIEFTPKEFKILKLFLENQDRILTREAMMNQVWDYQSDTLTRTVDMHISSVRKKINPYSGYLKTIRGVGYLFGIN